MPEPLRSKGVGRTVGSLQTVEIKRRDGGLYTVDYNPEYIHQVPGKQNRFETILFKWIRYNRDRLSVIAQFSFTQYDTIDEFARLFMERRSQKVDPVWETGINFHTWNVREELSDRLLDLANELPNFRARKNFSDYLMIFRYLGPQNPFYRY